ncbi:replicative DNA helicase [Gemmiger sp. An120]|uniref:replicative DNA helicase n=1 Tax=Gemmiger TaxID=204475 RepID=UPI000B3864CE|nr:MULTISPECIES: replicative DNA helicase [Gemmiger]MBM6914479.1 replicative DNA helicase [Gemmiger formicilis]OUQ43493.1 replicative DNA helicase [Gemmiger sp. An120]HIX33127.1 replicative DNA helicase [Candidatus Gemmiger avium]
MKDVSLNLESMGLSLPYNLRAEQSVLGAVLLEPGVLADLVEILRPEMFYQRSNGEIFSQMLRLYTAGYSLDFVTLQEAVSASGAFESPDAAVQYLTSIAETVPSVSNVKAYARIVEEKYRVRQLMLAAQSILEQSNEESDADLLLENAEQRLYEIRSGRGQTGLTQMNDVVVDTLISLQQLSGPNRSKYAGIPTGFTGLDELLSGGLGRSDLIILAARPGMGKTSFALNIATNVAKRQKIPVAIFSLEMGKDQIVSRILSSEAGIGSQAFRTGALTSSDWQDLVHVTELLHDVPIFMDDTSNITIPEIKAKIRQINRDTSRAPIGLIVIDYLQLMSTGKRTENRVQEISEITRNLKIMAKELNVPVIALSQLSRATEKSGRADHQPQLSDLRDSGSIEQDADIVLMLYREGYYASTSGSDTQVDADTAYCIVAKNRHGSTDRVPLGWDGAHTRFMNRDFVHEYN